MVHIPETSHLLTCLANVPNIPNILAICSTSLGLQVVSHVGLELVY